MSDLFVIVVASPPESGGVTMTTARTFEAALERVRVMPKVIADYRAITIVPPGSELGPLLATWLGPDHPAYQHEVEQALKGEIGG